VKRVRHIENLYTWQNDSSSHFSNLARRGEASGGGVGVRVYMYSSHAHTIC
jgi:hypothetical protein